MALYPAKANRAEQANVGTEVGADAGLAVPVLGDPLVVFVNIEAGLSNPAMPSKKRRCRASSGW